MDLVAVTDVEGRDELAEHVQGAALAGLVDDDDDDGRVLVVRKGPT